MTATHEPSTTIDVSTGRRESVVLNALILYHEQLRKTVKREEALGLSAKEAGRQLGTTLDLLGELGWSPPPPKSAKADDATGDLFHDDGTPE